MLRSSLFALLALACIISFHVQAVPPLEICLAFFISIIEQTSATRQGVSCTSSSASPSQHHAGHLGGG
jgi:hypothetical protein